MTYSLITVHSTNSDGTVDGAWLQDHIGTIRSAKAKAKSTSALNHDIDIAVVAMVGFCGIGEQFHCQRRLA